MTSTTGSAPSIGWETHPYIDVWTRTEPKYRRRAALLLGVTLLLFAGLCCFTYWLRTGLYGPWANSAFYWDLLSRSFDPVAAQQVTLIDFLLFPISVEQVPIQWVIIGLLLASLASIPILVAILYRFSASIVFALMVSGLAAMPWLGFTILLGCAIAALRPFRLKFRYASALLGLIPVAIYFITANQRPEGSFSMTPYHAKLAAPWVLAALGSCVICAVALALAHIINYRPGGIAPLLALLFAVPVVLFHAHVGRDELEYRILERDVGPGSDSVFVNRSLIDEVQRDATEAWAAQQGTSLNVLREQMLQERLVEVAEQEARDRQSVVARCDAFLARFAASRYIPNVLYLKARALDLRIDQRLLNRSGQLQFNAAFPRSTSRSTWLQLYEAFPDSDLAAFALYQAARFDASIGKLDDAVELLTRLLVAYQRFPTATQPTHEDARPTGLFGRPPPSSSLGFDPTSVLAPARKLQELIVVGRDDERHGSAPLLEWLAFNPLYVGAQYDERRHLEYLMNAYPGARLELHFSLLHALKLSPTRSVIESVLKLMESFGPTDPFQAEAMYYLGRAREDLGEYEAARAHFEELMTRFPASAFAFDAGVRRSAIIMSNLSQPAPTVGP